MKDNPEHLKTIRDRLLNNPKNISRLLGLYRNILTSNVKVNAYSSADRQQLQLSGLVVQKNSRFKVYNPIYKEIFNQQWIKRELDKLRPYSEAINAWLRSQRQDRSGCIPVLHKTKNAPRVARNEAIPLFGNGENGNG